MKMEELLAAIESVISVYTEVDWLIVRKLAEKFPEEPPGRFLFIDREEKFELPFQFSEGYLKIEGDEYEPFKVLLKELIEKNRDNLTTIANLFVLQNRTGCQTADAEDELESFFKEAVGDQQIPAVFEVLMKSLNQEFFRHTSVDRDPVVDAKDWFFRFRASAMVGRAYEVPVAVTALVSNNIQGGVDFVFVEQMKPSIRALLCEFWGMGISMGQDQVQVVVEKGDELPFLTVYLVERSQYKSPMPDWMTIDFIRQLFCDWKRTGAFLLEKTLGGYQRVGVVQPGQKQLEDLIRAVVAEKLVDASLKAAAWIEVLDFPKDYVGVFACLADGTVSYDKILFSNKQRLFLGILRDLERIFDDINIFVGENNDHEGPSYWPMSDPKFQFLFRVLLILYLDAGDNGSRKRFKKICFETKLLFYGAFRTSSLARKLAEMIFLTALSADGFTSTSTELFASLDILQSDLVNSILVPYVHTIEREEEIWNPEYEGVIGLLRSENLLVNDALGRIKNGPLFPNYSILFTAMDEIAVARWPYMDGRKVPFRTMGLQPGTNFKTDTD
jgi:hypothetical protein